MAACPDPLILNTLCCIAELNATMYRWCYEAAGAEEQDMSWLLMGDGGQLLNYSTRVAISCSGEGGLLMSLGDFLTQFKRSSVAPYVSGMMVTSGTGSRPYMHNIGIGSQTKNSERARQVSCRRRCREHLQ